MSSVILAFALLIALVMVSLMFAFLP